VEDIITSVTMDLKAISQTSFEQLFPKWKRQWERCVVVKGDYSERDIIQ
jgi:hypothetical protein